MSRFFAKLIPYRGSWVVNLLEFEGPTLTQRVTVSGEQTATYTNLRYDKRSKILSFFTNGEPESFKMHEIDEAVGRKLTEDHNWRNLQHGLKIKSPKTLAWLAQKGVLTEED